MSAMIRSVLAVLAGLVVLTIVSFGIEAVADPLLMHLFPGALPNAAALSANFPVRLFMLAYTTFSIAAGGYVTAWIAGRAQMWHAAIMGVIEVAFTLYVMIAAPFPEAHQAPHWWWIVGMILMVPAACLGAAVRAKQTPRRSLAAVSFSPWLILTSGYAANSDWSWAAVSCVITVMAVPPEKSIPGLTGIPTVTVTYASTTSDIASSTNGIITSCFGEYLSIL